MYKLTFFDICGLRKMNNYYIYSQEYSPFNRMNGKPLLHFDAEESRK